MDLYNKVEKFVVDAFMKVDKKNDVEHSKRTAYWIKKLKPDADEALLIAGVAHDIERAFYGDWKKGSFDPNALKKHQDLSAAEIEKFLIQENIDKKFIERVKMLVAHHEEGGDEDQNTLKDADTISFFERNFSNFISKTDKEQSKLKFDGMFNRTTSEKAKQIARPLYEKALKLPFCTKNGIL